MNRYVFFPEDKFTYEQFLVEPDGFSKEVRQFLDRHCMSIEKVVAPGVVRCRIFGNYNEAIQDIGTMRCMKQCQPLIDFVFTNNAYYYICDSTDRSDMNNYKKIKYVNSNKIDHLKKLNHTYETIKNNIIK